MPSDDNAAPLGASAPHTSSLSSSPGSRPDTERGEEDVFVTRPLLPPLEDLLPYLEEAWRRGIVSNRGPLARRFEEALCAYLRGPKVSLVANGTLGLVLALRARAQGEEVITTPFTFVATGSAILEAGLRPVFVDVDRETYNIGAEVIEAAITPRTGAILPVHCFGRACDVIGIEAVARRHHVPLIYDAAHAFGVRFGEFSLLAYGDLSVVSFHATKVFNTFEGGAIVSHSEEDKERLDRLSNFGLGERTRALGLNAKLNEISCAMGLASLPHLDAALRGRARVAASYREALSGIPGVYLPPAPRCQTENHAYFPIEVQPPYPLSRDELLSALAARRLFARAYFHPLLPDLETFVDASGHAPPLVHARRVADRILCLPIAHDLSLEAIDRVVTVIREGALQHPPDSRSPA